MVWIKICGITNTGDAEIAVRYGAGALGFIFSTDSPRRISLETASSIIDYLQELSIYTGKENAEMKGNRSGTTGKVGVFVNEDIEKVASYSRKLRLSHAQLSGDEDKDYIKKLKEEIPGIKVIKAIRIGSDAVVQSKNVKETVSEFRILADHILMDG